MRPTINKLADLLAYTKMLRAFDAETVLQQKIEKINNFFRTEQLDSAVVGISGGIDSALVVALLFEASKAPNSPIKYIDGLILPIECKGTSTQDEATSRANILMLCVADKSMPGDEEGTNAIVNWRTNSLSDVCSRYVAQEYPNPFQENDEKSWAIGQLASIIRTPALYFHAAIMQTQGKKSIVVGTTNRDEGAYIGFFGKASDAMVDLQPIADLHKSEVYALAIRLGLPLEIVSAVPRGDVWDGKSDEEMIGAPYWFIEMFLTMKDFDLWYLADELFSNDENEWQKYFEFSNAVETIHYKNRHKYKVGSPARFIDVMQRKVKGGW